MNASLISIVLPIYNQADHVGSVVQEYEEALARVTNPHELILVVNGCRDRSLDICRDLAKQYSSVQAIDTEKAGWGLAVKRGLEAAQGELLCYTNLARTSASDLILLILYAIANPGAVVKPHRRSRESFKRKIGSFLYNLECRGLFDLPTWDINATPKVFCRDIYHAIRLTSDGDLIDLEFYIECHRVGTVILEVPVYSRQRRTGQSTTTFISAARLYWGALDLWRTMRGGRT